MQHHLVWLRHDIRLLDNPALYFACENPLAVVHALFTLTPKQWSLDGVSKRKAWFLKEHLALLREDLQQLGIHFHFMTVPTYQAIPGALKGFCCNHKISKLFFNRHHAVNEIRCERSVLQVLGDKLTVHRYEGDTLLPLGSIKNQQGRMFQVFTPFRHAVIAQLEATPLVPLPKPAPRPSSGVATGLTCDAIVPFEYPVRATSGYTPGERAARARLDSFLENQAASYRDLRDLPSENGTSQLSAYFTLGVLSVRQALASLLRVAPDLFYRNDSDGFFTWFSELVWREFYRHLMLAYPKLSMNQPFINWTKGIRWKTNEEHLAAWKAGRTGYPIVDAGMRQLKHTGWMHNRLRMIVANFLVKDLQLDWHLGERYFLDELIDGDFSSNNGGWQWSASTGTDAQPFFRIFSPLSQANRYDPLGSFTREWVPELKAASVDVLTRLYGETRSPCRLPAGYPAPLVSHAAARQEALELFRQAKAVWFLKNTK